MTGIIIDRAELDEVVEPACFVVTVDNPIVDFICTDIEGSIRTTLLPIEIDLDLLSLSRIAPYTRDPQSGRRESVP